MSGIVFLPWITRCFKTKANGVQRAIHNTQASDLQQTVMGDNVLDLSHLSHELFSNAMFRKSLRAMTPGPLRRGSSMGTATGLQHLGPCFRQEGIKTLPRS